MRKILLFSAVLLLSACGKAGIGEACSEASDCGENTTCILNGGEQISGGELTCNETDLLCSVTCRQDTDCASLGTGYICINDCFQGSCLKGSRSGG